MGFRLVHRCRGGNIDHDVVAGHERKAGVRIDDVQHVAVDHRHLVSTQRLTQ